jgi:hypothetical protein
MSGKIRLVGVYRLPMTDAMVYAQARELYGDAPSADDVEQVRKQLRSTVLVEVLVSGADAGFRVGDFTQADSKEPRDNWQAAWAEAYLSPDGEALLAKGEAPPGERTDLRLAFYLHAWHADRPLETSFGRIAAAAPSAMPERLRRLVPYEPLD